MSTEKFHHKVGTKEIVLPRFDNIPFGVIRKSRKLPQEDQFFFMIEELASEKDLAIIDTIGTKDIEKLIQAWQKHSGVTLGESTAS